MALSSSSRIGVAQLRGRLSHYLKQAHDGKRLIVTDHGNPVAEIIPLIAENARPTKSTLGETLERLAAEGFLSRAPDSRRSKFGKFKPITVGAPENCIASRMVAKDREES